MGLVVLEILGFPSKGFSCLVVSVNTCVKNLQNPSTHPPPRHSTPPPATPPPPPPPKKRKGWGLDDQKVPFSSLR